MIQTIFIIITITLIIILILVTKSHKKVYGIYDFLLNQTLRKNKNKEKIVLLLRQKERVSNMHIREYLGVSARTIVSYMDELEKEEKVMQVGHTGKWTYYTLK